MVKCDSSLQRTCLHWSRVQWRCVLHHSSWRSEMHISLKNAAPEDRRFLFVLGFFSLSRATCFSTRWSRSMNRAILPLSSTFSFHNNSSYSRAERKRMSEMLWHPAIYSMCGWNAHWLKRPLSRFQTRETVQMRTSTTERVRNVGLRDEDPLTPDILTLSIRPSV